MHNQQQKQQENKNKKRYWTVDRAQCFPRVGLIENLSNHRSKKAQSAAVVLRGGSKHLGRPESQGYYEDRKKLGWTCAPTLS